MKVLVTGANGLLGHHVVMRLLEQTLQVKIIVRTTTNIHFNLSEVEVCEGNFNDYFTLKNAAKECDAIIHIAAVTATNLLNYADYKTINVSACASIILVANELNINKLIFVSTANTIGFGSENKLADEYNSFQYPFSNSFYAKSKLEAEQLFVEASKLPNKHIIIINPTFLIGAYDTKPSSGKLLLMGYKKRYMITPSGGKNFVPVSDVAIAICNALTQGKNGERYLASGVNMSFSAFYSLQAAIDEYKQTIIQLPDFMLIIVGKMGDILRKYGLKTEICSMNLRQLIVSEHYTNRKAKEELSMPQTKLDIAIREALNWFKQNGMVK